MALGFGPAVTLSPDGSALVYVASRGETTELYTRSLDSLEAVPIPGTGGGTYPFFAPGADWLGFFADGKLKKRLVSGGTAVSLADAPAERERAGASTIVSSSSPGGRRPGVGRGCGSSRRSRRYRRGAATAGPKFFRGKRSCSR
jgi:hypothetical protein